MFDSEKARAARDVLSSEYHREVMADAEAIKADILNGSLEDDDAVETRIGEDADNAVTYTLPAWLICAFSEHDGAYKDEFGVEPDTIEARAAYAYTCDLRECMRRNGISVDELKGEAE